MSKRCTKCGIEKDESEFNRDRGRKDGLFSWCRECANAQSRKWHHENWVHSMEVKKVYESSHAEERAAYRLEHREQILQRNKERYAQGRALVESLKLPCAKCGDSRKYVIDFHHIDPDTKLFEVSKSTTGRAHKSILQEVEKCICMCRNCHTEFHYLYGNVPAEPIKALKEYLGESVFNEQRRDKGIDNTSSDGDTESVKT